MNQWNLPGRVTDAVRLRVDRRIKHLAASRSELAELSKNMKEQSKTFADAKALLESANILFGPDARHNTRVILRQDLKNLAAEVAEIADVPDAWPQVVQAYRSLVTLESLGLGRIAGTTQNVVGKLCITALLATPQAQVLEIGTLFGLFATALTHELTRYGGISTLTVVDPLVDVQLQSDRRLGSDKSATPVCERVVVANLHLAGPVAQAGRVFAGFSEDPAIRAQAGDRLYDVIVVDGDHSAEGVARDLEWAETIIAPGGLVVLDDFGGARWPGVQEATENHLKGDTKLELVGVVATSAYLRAPQS